MAIDLSTEPYLFLLIEGKVRIDKGQLGSLLQKGLERKGIRGMLLSVVATLKPPRQCALGGCLWRLVRSFHGAVCHFRQRMVEEEGLLN